MSASTIMHKRAQFLIVKIGSKKVGLMNIDAHNSTSERACLWLSLSEYASLDNCWLVGGDCNMIEDASNRKYNYYSFRLGSEVLGFLLFCLWST